MSKLVAVQRADKNGKIVTRHIKSDDATKKAKNIGAPSLTSYPPVPKLRSALADALKVPMDELSKKMTNQYKLSKLLTLAKYHDLTYASEDTAYCIYLLKGKNFDRCIESLERHHDLADEVLSAIGDHRETAPVIVSGLNLYPFEMTQDEESTLVVAACHIWSDNAAEDNDFLTTVFPDTSEWKESRAIGMTALNTELAKYILKHPDKVEAITKVICSRKVTNPTDIDVFMNGSDSVTLIDGVL